MTRYQVVYSKKWFPLTIWRDDAEAAHNQAEQLRRAGYSVQVWAHTKSGARMTSL